MMKFKILLFLLVGSAYFVVISCQQKEKEKLLITERIQYDVPVKNQNPDDDWWVENIVGPQREKFIKTIMDKAYSGEMPAYDYFNDPLTPEQVKRIGIDTLYQTLMRTTPPYDEYDTMIITKIDYDDITKIRFLEEWTIDEETLEINKKIFGIAPVVVINLSGKDYNMLLFWLYPDEKYPLDK